MALANVSLTDTFDTWRIRTNQLIVLYDQSNNQISSAFSNVPLAFGHANAAFDKANAANVLAFNAFPKTGGDITGNTTFSSNVNFLSNTTFSGVTNFSSTNNVTFSSNNVFFLGNTSISGLLANGSLGSSGQLLTSNGSGIYWSAASLTLTSNNTDSQTFYIPMSNTDSGLWSNGIVSNAKLFFVPSTGTLSSIEFDALSDEKYKTNINQIENALDGVSKLRGVTFHWKDNDKSSIGIIAQEVEKVFPQLVTIHDENKSVNYNGIIGVLIEAIKELNQEIQNLKSNKE